MPEPRFSRHAPATAPPDVILDEDDMTEIRDALRAGHGVGLSGDGKVYTNHKLAGDHEPDGSPMTGAQQAYVEGRLGDVRNLVREGWNVSIKPDGRILANPPGNSHDRYFAGPDRTIDAEEMAWIDSAIRSGHMVHVYPDRSVLVVEHEVGAPAAAGTADQREGLVRQFHESLPKLQADLDAGRQIMVSPDGSLTTPDVEASKYLYPADDEVPPTLRNADALDEEAAQLRAHAEALHEAGRTLTKEIDVRGAKADQLEQAVHSARAASTTAQEQADKIQNEANATGLRATDHDNQADALVAQGRTVEAEEYREVAASLRARQVSLTERAESAHKAAVAEAAKADELQSQLPERITWHPQAVPIEKVADQLDEKARLLEEAARSERDAARESAHGDPGAASGSRNYARYAVEKADAVKPDYSTLDPTELQRHGIDISYLPIPERVDAAVEDPVADDVLGTAQLDVAAVDPLVEAEPSDDAMVTESDVEMADATSDADALSMPDAESPAFSSSPSFEAPLSDETAFAMDDESDFAPLDGADESFDDHSAPFGADDVIA